MQKVTFIMCYNLSHRPTCLFGITLLSLIYFRYLVHADILTVDIFLPHFEILTARVSIIDKL